jgi:hypothetical protein
MTFFNPLMLFGLAAAAIPILIHLLNRRRLRTVEFSSLAFLKELQRTSVRRVKLRQWLLLLLRTLTVLFLVLAFARPALVGPVAGFGGRSATSTMLLFDDSPSMTARNGNGVLFDQAKTAAKRIVASTRDGDEILVLRMSDARTSVEPIAMRSKESAASEIDRLKPSPVRTPFGSALPRALSLLSKTAQPNHELVFLSDCQANQWIADSVSVRQQSTVRLFVVRTGEESLPNSAIISAKPASTLLTPSTPIELSARVASFNDNRSKAITASVFLNDLRVGQQAVDLPSNGVSSANIRFVSRKSGLLGGSVEIDDGAVDVDNKRFFTLSIPEKITVALVGGSADDIKYLKTGLTLAGDSTLAGLFSVRTFTEAEFGGLDFSSVDVVALANIHSITPATGGRLIRFLKSGGGMLLMPGSSTIIGDVNTNLLVPLGIPPLVPVTAPNPTTPSLNAGLGIGMLDREHPIFSGIFETRSLRGGASIESPRVRQWFQLPISRLGRTVITLSNGSPLLVDYPAGSGHLLAYSVDAGTSWSDLPVTGLFVPLIMRSVLYLSNRQIDQREFVTGGELTVQLRLPAGTGSDVFSWVSPSGREERTIPDIRPQTGLASFRTTATDEPGVYILQKTSSQNPHAPLTLYAAAVNTDTAEANLRQAPSDSIRAFANRLGIASDLVSILDAGEGIGTTVEQSRFGIELWRPLLIAALVAALAEMLVSRLESRKSPPTERRTE